MISDKVFAKEQASETDFTFNREVTSVFDDMVSRSVPFYNEIQRMTADLAADFAVEGTNLYDIGCSTGTTLAALDPLVDPGVGFVGIDASADMLDRAREKLAEHGLTRSVELVQADANQGVAVHNASAALLVLTLQFVRPLNRHRLIASISRGLNDQGGLILVEKLTCADSLFNRLFIKHYYAMKRRNGYSDTEITRKRAALENVLIPYRFEENRQLLLEHGFTHVEEFFRWFNFCGIVAVK